ncbi:MAG: GAF domain-containing protein [Proteobacteria bacterium]|nr:GAF domain-containing protein [Pseudomonadota bacterium]
MLQHTKSARDTEAIESTRAGLALLDYTMVADNYMDAMLAAFGKLQGLLGGQPASSFLDRPTMTDPVAIGTTRLLSRAMAAAFYIDPLLYSVLGFESMKLIAEHGNPTDGMAVYAQYGHLLSAMFGDPPGGYEFTVLARELCDRTGSMADKAQACFLSGNWAHCWVRPMRDARPIVEDGIQAGLQAGEIQFATYNMVYLSLNALVLGDPLDQMLEQSAADTTFCQKVKEKIAEDASQAIRHSANALAGNTAAYDDFSCDGLTEEAFLERAVANGAAMVLCYFHAFKVAALNLCNDRTAALAALREASTTVASIPGNITVGRIAFHTGLALTGVIPDAADDERAALTEELDKVLEQLAGYVVHCEANWGHTHALVEAEKARIDGDGPAAIAGYERAIELAEEHRWPADHALACELAGRYWALQGRDELSRGYLTQTRYGYELWGAQRKVELLDAEFGALTEARSVPTAGTIQSVSVTSTEASTGLLDLAAVIKASQAISGEIKLERLLSRLMELVVENAGAQHGVLVVVDEGELAVRAAARLVTDATGEQALTTNVELNVSLDSYSKAATSVIQHVARTSEPVVLNDAVNEGRFTKDGYIVRTRPRSVLCLPLRNKGATVGLLYLENGAVVGAFTEDRLEVINLLASQFSISFENARLYNEMEGKAASRTEQLAAKNEELVETLDDLRVTQDKLVARTKFIRATFGRYVSDDVVEHLLEDPEALKLGGERRPITVLASDVRGFTSLAEQLEPEEVLALLNRYFEVMFAVIHRHGGTINAILGDGLFVFFGAPIAQDDAPRQAVRCALAMMLAMEELKAGGGDDLSKLEMGIGVHTGAAVVGNIGSQARTKYSAIGLDVNLAARIEGCTVGGQILISEATASAAEDLVLSGSMEFSTKGVAKPLTLFEVEGLGGAEPLRYRRKRASLTQLPVPSPLRFQVVSGGVVAATVHAGAFRRMSAEEGELMTGMPLAPLTDLKIQFLNEAGTRIGGDLYAKVLEVGANGTHVGFTSVPPEVRDHLTTLLD